MINKVISGIKITWNLNGLILSKSHYFDKIVWKFNKNDIELARMHVDTMVISQVKFSKIIGSLIYLINQLY